MGSLGLGQRCRTGMSCGSGKPCSSGKPWRAEVGCAKPNVMAKTPSEGRDARSCGAQGNRLALVLKTHDRRTLSINFPTRITIPIFHRLRLNPFLRKRGNNVIVELVCTQSGRIEQLSAPTEYMVKDDVTFNIV